MSEVIASLPVAGSAAIIGFFLLAKVYAVAHFSLTTATALVSASPQAVLLGTLASYIYPLIALGAFLCLFIWVRWGAFDLPMSSSVLLLTGFVSLSLLSPWLYWLASASLFVILLGGLLARKPPPVRSGISDRWHKIRLRTSNFWIVRAVDLVALVGICAGLILFLAKTIDQPWLPAEVVSFSQPQVDGGPSTMTGHLHESSIVVGYVVDDTDGWSEILTSPDRYLMHVPTETIQARYTCRVEGEVLSGKRPILDWFLRKNYHSPNHSCSTLVNEFLSPNG